MDQRIREVVRYLGYGAHAVDDKTLEMIRSSLKELDQINRYRVVYRIFELQVSGEDKVQIGKLQITSKNLAKNVRGCRQAILLGATLGIETDMRMKKYAVTDMARYVVLQAGAATVLEEELDRWQQELAERLRKENDYLRPRFSPGYGDLDIRHQKEVLQMLDAGKTIGLTMTDGYMLTPTKSVTAIIGISKENTACHRSGCEVCEKKDCIYRRGM